MKPIKKAKTDIPIKNIVWHLLVKEMIGIKFISKKDLAERCGVCSQCVYNWKNRTKTPSPSAKQKLLEIAQKEGIDLGKFEVVSDRDAITKYLVDAQGKELVRIFELYQKMSRNSQVKLLKCANTMVK